MKYCPGCGATNSDNALFCGKCGHSLSFAGNRSSSASGETSASGNEKGSSWVDSLNDYVGNDRPADLNWKVLFSDVFKKHSKEEAEAIFICGTTTTTPSPAEVSKDWPHPWLYSRVLLMFLSAFVLLWICCSVFGNTNALPGLIVVGAFAVPLSTLILFVEVNAWRNVSMYEVLYTFLVGGCASLVTTLFLFSVYTVEDLDFFGATMVGLIEELGKVVIVYLFLRRIRQLSILAGLLVGASVGAGFAAFESAGYALQPMIQFMQYTGYAAAYGQQLDSSMMLDAINQSIFLRGFLAPGGHVAWAAISGAALVIASRVTGGVMSVDVFANKKFWRLFIIPVILHALWDSPLSVIGSDIFLIPILLLLFVWIVVLILINMGLSEVSRIAR